MTCFLWGTLALWYLAGGYWGAVVKSGGDSVWSAPEGTPGATVVTKIEEGTPIYVTSSLEANSVRIAAPDGSTGWMNALSVRVIKTLQ